MYWLLTLSFGGIIGFSLGLTGGGGAIFAVPLLVYGLGVAPREAVGISLAAVGVTSFVGFLGRWRAQKVEIRTGLVFAVAGMLGAPVGAWLSGLIPETVLLALFAMLMLIVALRMWSKASEPAIAGLPIACSTEAADVDGPACRRPGLPSRYERQSAPHVTVRVVVGSRRSCHGRPIRFVRRRWWFRDCTGTRLVQRHGDPSCGRHLVAGDHPGQRFGNRIAPLRGSVDLG
jgi:hypothetical protein